MAVKRDRANLKKEWINVLLYCCKIRNQMTKETNKQKTKKKHKKNTKKTCIYNNNIPGLGHCSIPYVLWIGNLKDSRAA